MGIKTQSSYFVLWQIQDGDLASFLDRKGWVVVAVDLLADFPTDLHNDKVYCKIIDDIRLKTYDVLGVATPCETFSPLRETPPGPRPLWSMQHPAGLLSKEHGLTKAELDQVQKSNTLCRRSQETIENQVANGGAMWWENPDHGPDKIDLWKTEYAKMVLRLKGVHLCSLDQCTMGAETTKPTNFAYCRLDLSNLHGKRCDHPIREFKREDGKVYKARHESLENK